jgi:hypothetical protein
VQDLQRIDGDKRGTARAFAPVVLAAAALAVLAGCGSEPSRTVPAACTRGPAPIERALLRAPGEVRLGGRRLSECFAPGGDAAAVEALGLAYLPAAARLAADARAHPHGPAPVRLGFLIGAVRRGAARGGVYAELQRRLELELAGVDTGAPGFRSGERAGRARG